MKEGFCSENDPFQILNLCSLSVSICVHLWLKISFWIHQSASPSMDA